MVQLIGRFTSAAAEARFRGAYSTAMARLPAPAGTEVIETVPERAGSTTMWEPNIPAWSAKQHRADRPQ